MIVALAVTLLSFYLFSRLASTIAAAFGVGDSVVWLLYFIAAEVSDRYDCLHAPSWRRSRFARWVGRTLMRTSFTVESLEQLGALQRQALFLCEPHGVACLHLVFGFAAHGGTLPPTIGDRVRVVAHPIYRAIPLVRTLYAAFGVIDSSSASIERALARGDSLALTPSALPGKCRSLLYPLDGLTVDHDARTVVWRRSRHGWAYNATRFALDVVPVLSPDEDYAYRRFGVEHGVVALVVPSGWWFIRPMMPIEWRVGRPMRCNARTDVRNLVTMVYKQLTLLGNPTHGVVEKDE